MGAEVMRTRIKVCGLKAAADVAAAVAGGADALGFVFYEPSPRAVTLEQVLELVQDLPPFVVPVGLFVNADPTLVESVLKALPDLLLQFHGDETPADCERWGRPYLRAARMSPEMDLLDFAHRYEGAQALLLDAHVDGYGGAGKTFDWSLIPKGLNKPIILSGGLRPENVVQAILSVRPVAVDVSSGVERERGVKDARLIGQFCKAVRRADSHLLGQLSLKEALAYE
jgi:phosphoribosylanthranilate isomerase